MLMQCTSNGDRAFISTQLPTLRKLTGGMGTSAATLNPYPHTLGGLVTSASPATAGTYSPGAMVWHEYRVSNRTLSDQEMVDMFLALRTKWSL